MRMACSLLVIRPSDRFNRAAASKVSRFSYGEKIQTLKKHGLPPQSVQVEAYTYPLDCSFLFNVLQKKCTVASIIYLSIGDITFTKRITG